MSVVAIGEQVDTDSGLVVATLTVATVTLHVVHVGPGVERADQCWEAVDPKTGDRFTCVPGGGGGTEAWNRSQKWLELPPDVREVDIHAGGGSSAVRVRLDATPEESLDVDFVFDDEPLNRIAIERVWASSIRTAVVPLRIRVWEAVWHDSPFGPVRPQWTEHWRGCDIVWFQFRDEVQPQPHRFGVKQIGNRSQRIQGVPLGGGSTLDGVGLLVGFATDAD